MLSDKEKKLVNNIGFIMNGFKEIEKDFMNEFPDKFEEYEGDWEELCMCINRLQNWVLSNSAARTYPDEFRPFGVKHVKH